MQVNVNQFPEIGFFLSHKKDVKSLEKGAKKFGGATKIHDKIFSNYEVDDIIRIEENNIIGLFVPSTVDVKRTVNNWMQVNKYFQKIEKRYPLANISLESAKGSWMAENGEIIIEDITIIQTSLGRITAEDLQFFIKIAKELKEEMRQEGLSLAINDSLAII